MGSTARHTPSTNIEEIAAAATQLASNNGYATEALISTLEHQVLNQPAINQDNLDIDSVYLEKATEAQKGILVVHVCRMEGYLTQGSEELKIPLDYQDNTVQDAVDLIFDSSPKVSTSIKLGDQAYHFDHKLKYSVYNTLMQFLSNISD